MSRTEVVTHTGPPISLGTIDLRSFCHCPEPCPDCCTVCCAGIDTTMFLSIFDDAGCSCATLINRPMTYSGGQWDSGSFALGSCGPSARFILRCTGDTANKFRLDVSGCQTVNNNVPTMASCSPFLLQFSIETTTCCLGGGGPFQVFQVEITL